VNPAHDCSSGCKAFYICSLQPTNLWSASPSHPKQRRPSQKRVPPPSIRPPTRIAASLFLFHDEAQGASTVSDLMDRIAGMDPISNGL